MPSVVCENKGGGAAVDEDASLEVADDRLAVTVAQVVGQGPYTDCGIGDVLFLDEAPATEIYTLSLHDALPIFGVERVTGHARAGGGEHEVLGIGGRIGHLGVADRGLV